ncbi:hypothetical protein DB30_04587 [Enhygromyxa salina]|uniref:Uncharacterized protein n=1 Tax=Enhygromyxa salina TaxID=215803 RepID=A0A0C2DHE6_9BACT|nr:hypothetical protein DB30_04587 [Enhygromyxa salina]
MERGYAGRSARTTPTQARDQQQQRAREHAPWRGPGAFMVHCGIC